MQSERQQSRSSRIPVGRAVLSALAFGALSTSALGVSAAGAQARSSAKSVVVSTIKTAKFGKILVSGKTLYTLKASKTACTAVCVKVWPELVLPKGVTKATAGAGVKASKLGTIKRSGGVLQVTYSGKPLYWFSGDTAAGQVTGNITDIWGKWSDVSTTKSSSSSSSSGSGGSSSGTGGAGF
jgi:predicted lipoprotein with Yx(FWY)xxD motif